MYDYPLDYDWSTDEILIVINLYNAVEKAYEEGNMTHKEEWALVNPKLVAYTQKEAYIKAGEGCLSVPEDLQGYVPRHAKVVVEAYDAITDKQVKITARGFFSMCLQHEMDHLDGILYYDHFNKDNPLAPIPNAMVIE